MNKLISFILATVLLFAMGTQSFCATTTENQSMTVTTVIPSEHKIKITYSEGGFVLLNGRICPSGTVLTVDRFNGINLDIIRKKGYDIKKILINGEDVTAQFKNGTLEIRNVVDDINAEFSFINNGNDDTNKKKIDMEGYVFLGKHKLQKSQIDVDFGTYKGSSDKNGRYSLQDIPEGRHFVSISKDGEKLANFQFVLERADVSETKIEILPDGTKKVTAPLNAEKVYVDFIIADSDGNQEPDVDPDITDPTLPPDLTPDPEPDNGKPDDDGVKFETGEKEKDPVLPSMGVMIVKYPWLAPLCMALSMAFIIILLVIRKKKQDEDENQMTD